MGKQMKCRSSGTMYKFKYLATCSRFASDDVCLTREATNPEELDKQIATTGVKVSLKPCSRKKLDMSAAETKMSADQTWLKREYKYELPPPPPSQGIAKPKFENYHTITVPFDWLIKLKMVNASVDYVPVEGQEYCLTAGFNGDTGNTTDSLTVQVCEHDR